MIHVTVCGHDSNHHNPCDISHPNGLDEYLLLLVKSHAWFYIDGKRIETQPNMVIIFDKNVPIRYGCDERNYNDDWIHFYITGEQDNKLFSELNIPLNCPHYPVGFYRLSNYVKLLTSEFRSRSQNYEEILDLLMRAFLYSLKEVLSQPIVQELNHRLYGAFCQLRANIYNNPAYSWNAKKMSASLDISISYFQHLYKQFFNCSCQRDIINARLEQAKIYLTRSEINIQNLAYFCGYENELHFMRQFKKFEGMTPSEYRKAHKLLK